jgi:hypothetical protein
MDGIPAVEWDLAAEIPRAVSARGLVVAREASHLIRLVTASREAVSPIRVNRWREQKDGMIRGRPRTAWQTGLAAARSLDGRVHDASPEWVAIDAVERRGRTRRESCQHEARERIRRRRPDGLGMDGSKLQNGQRKGDLERKRTRETAGAWHAVLLWTGARKGTVYIRTDKC